MCILRNNTDRYVLKQSSNRNNIIFIFELHGTTQNPSFLLYGSLRTRLIPFRATELDNVHTLDCLNSLSTLCILGISYKPFGGVNIRDYNIALKKNVSNITSNFNCSLFDNGTISYRMRNILSACVYWDKKIKDWSSEGCRVRVDLSQGRYS